MRSISIELLTPYPSKERDSHPEMVPFLSRLRYRIDLVFSNLMGRYSVKRVRVRDLRQLMSRLVRKAVSHTVAFLLNARGNPFSSRVYEAFLKADAVVFSA